MPYSEPHSAFPARRVRAGIVIHTSSGRNAAGEALCGSLRACLSASTAALLSLAVGHTMPAKKRLAVNADRQAECDIITLKEY